jgi:hypothetical protein
MSSFVLLAALVPVLVVLFLAFYLKGKYYLWALGVQLVSSLALFVALFTISNHDSDGLGIYSPHFARDIIMMFAGRGIGLFAGILAIFLVMLKPTRPLTQREKLLVTILAILAVLAPLLIQIGQFVGLS